MKKLSIKTIDQAIKTAQNFKYFQNLNRIYDTIPLGKCQGCANCCMESVHTHFVEFLHIWDYLKSHRSLLEELFPKIIRYYFLELVTKEYCPFLNEEKMCTIYSYRPLVCRLFGHWTESEYEESYREVLKSNLQNVKLFKNQYRIQLPDEVVHHKIPYCRNFEVQKRIRRPQRQTMVDSIFTMESGFFMRGLLSEEYINTGLVSWFAYTVFDIEEASHLRVKIMREYIEDGFSETLEEALEKVKIPF